MMTLISLVYVSLAYHDMNADELKTILESSHRHNKPDNITGMLLYRDGYFIQALEGEAVKVEATYERIKLDTRHKNVVTVYKEEIEERTFNEWTMGFKNLDDVDPESLPAFTDFLTQPMDAEDFAKHPSRAKLLLESFRHHIQF